MDSNNVEMKGTDSREVEKVEAHLAVSMAMMVVVIVMTRLGAMGVTVVLARMRVSMILLLGAMCVSMIPTRVRVPMILRFRAMA